MKHRCLKSYRAKTARIALVERDGTLCQLCNEEMPEDDRTIDHIVPRSDSGDHKLENLQLAHAACNSRRQSMPMDEWHAYYKEHRELKEWVEFYKPIHTFKIGPSDQQTC